MASTGDLLAGLAYEFTTPTNEFLSSKFEEVSPHDFYRDIFPIGSLENAGEYVQGKYNGIACEIIRTVSGSKAKRFTITDDLGIIDQLARSENFVITSPISYAGKARTSRNARFLHALAIDIDGIVVTEDFYAWGLQKLLKQMAGQEHNKVPMATYIVSSGTGIHAYWVLEKPIPLFQNVVEELEKYKRRLTWQIWSQGCSSLYDKIQYESLFQGFRMVGTLTKHGGRVRAFRVGERVNFDYLNSCVPSEFRAEIRAYRSELTLAQARDKYPDWYQKRIIEKRKKGRWVANKALYRWWLEKVKSGADVGHRYWCVMALATYAKKCDVSFEQLEQDAISLLPILEEKTIDDVNHFTREDIDSALKAYSEEYVTYPIKTIVNRTDIPIEKNKRNGRRQYEHLTRARAVQEVDYPNGAWRKGNGRPSKREVVERWRAENPRGRKIDCERDTGLSRPTVLKWW